jgi:2-methylisocitrate lyase-like PEP mutase family enzyme
MADTRPVTAAKRRVFHDLHKAGCFVIPNPWDVGSARFLQSIGFKALATTSSGFAWTKGRPDGGISRDMALAHLHEMVAATELPVNADFESGFAADAAGVAESARLAVETGVAGLSIEDSTGDAARPLYDLDTAVERVRAARNAIDKTGGDALLVGRAECFLVGRPDLAETIARLKAYAEAGADCLYAPGIHTPEQIRAVVDAAAPNRSTCWSARQASSPCRKSPRSACGASASAARSPGRPGAASCARPGCSRSKASSTAWPTPPPARS